MQRRVRFLLERTLEASGLWQFMGKQFSSVTQTCLTLCNPTGCSTLGFSVHHQLPELAQAHVHRVGDAIQPSPPLSFPSPPAFNLSHHHGLFHWVSSSHQVAKVLEYEKARWGLNRVSLRSMNNYFSNIKRMVPKNLGTQLFLQITLTSGSLPLL